MGLLPNYRNAIIDLIKLEAYCLNESHPVGKFKAKVFKATLALESKDSAKLKGIIMDNLGNFEAQDGLSDVYGKRFFVDIILNASEQEFILRTGWIIRPDENFPRFVTCYIK